MNSSKTRKIIFIYLSISALVAAIYHLVNLFYKTDDSPAWRHILFTFICFSCAYYFIARPKYFVYLFGALVIQQYYSHGSYLILLWREQQKIHWISIAVLIFMATCLICLVKDHNNTKV